MFGRAKKVMRKKQIAASRPENETSAAPAGMVLVPGGTFSIGSASGAPGERPTHLVELDAFYMDVTEVTNAEFAVFVSATGYQTTSERLDERRGVDDGDGPGMPSWRDFADRARQAHPVVCVSWFDAMAYLRWAGKRLPTEAEWEVAARGGLADKAFPWGDSAPTSEQANWGRADSAPDIVPTVPSSDLAANAYGLRSMVGNVWEWCSDWYGETYYAASPRVSPTGPTSGEYRVRRGGAWNVTDARRLRCANRGAMLPDSFWRRVGFRGVLSARSST
jgi:sulfatase modifying factor 1